MVRWRKWRLWFWCFLLTVSVYVFSSLVMHRYTFPEISQPLRIQAQFMHPAAKNSQLQQANRKKNTITLYDPFTRDYSDSIGLRGLQKFDCVRTIEGFPVDLQSKKSSVVRLPDKAFTELTEDCQAFRERYGYRRYHQATEKELKFPLAFNILLYKEVDHLHLLLRAIYRAHNAYCLHVDGYAEPQVFEATRRLAACLPNVFLVSRRENITYSGFSRLQADLNCMEDHWRRSSGQSVSWRYLINLPSQEFPLKTNLELVKILTIYNGSNDIEAITGNRRINHRFTFKHVYRPVGGTGRLQIVRTQQKHDPAPHNISVVKGSAYGVFSRDFVNYILHDKRAKDLLQWCRAVDSPDEYYWATLNHNPHLHAPGGYNGVPDKKPWLAVYASWPPRDLCLSGKIMRGICIFGMRDLPQLVARRELFANKFYLDFQPETLHCLDQWLVNKSRAALPLDSFYYRQLPFVKS